MDTTTSTQQFIAWLAAEKPAYYAVAKRMQRATGAPAHAPSGMHGLGDASTDASSSSFLDSLTSALTSVTSGITTVSTDTALVQYNLNRAKQGLAPVSALPTTVTVVPTATQNVLTTAKSMLTNPWVLGGMAVVTVGLIFLLKPKRKGK